MRCSAPSAIWASCLALLGSALLSGCAVDQARRPTPTEPPAQADFTEAPPENLPGEKSPSQPSTSENGSPDGPSPELESSSSELESPSSQGPKAASGPTSPVGFQSPSGEDDGGLGIVDVEELPPPADAQPSATVSLTEVVRSVHNFFPLVEAAYLERPRTAGDQLAAWGEFDTKLKMSTENQPLGFYENYQHSAGVTQPRYQGGELFGGYRLGRGSFEPWYQERETNAGGELKAGFLVPLARDRAIDARRAELWRATYDRQIAEPEIREQLIAFVRDASFAYWQWIAAGRQVQIGEAALDLAQQRNDKLERRVELGDLDPPVLRDNERAIAERRAKLLDRRRKLAQAAVKLSLYLRGPDAAPIVPEAAKRPAFPGVERIEPDRIDSFVRRAMIRRPELESLELRARRTRVDLAEARNDLLPDVDAGVVGSQDVGEPTKSLRDKSEFELELGLYFELPVQRRKGYGKLRSARAKLGQIDAKLRFTVNKITTEIQVALAALEAAFGRVERTREAVELATDLAEIERRKFELGESDLLSVFLREQFAIEAADELVLALLDYHSARTALVAALGYEWPGEADVIVEGSDNAVPEDIGRPPAGIEAP